MKIAVTEPGKETHKYDFPTQRICKSQLEWVIYQNLLCAAASNSSKFLPSNSPEEINEFVQITTNLLAQEYVVLLAQGKMDVNVPEYPQDFLEGVGTLLKNLKVKFLELEKDNPNLQIFETKNGDLDVKVLLEGIE